MADRGLGAYLGRDSVVSVGQADRATRVVPYWAPRIYATGGRVDIGPGRAVAPRAVLYFEIW